MPTIIARDQPSCHAPSWPFRMRLSSEASPYLVRGLRMLGRGTFDIWVELGRLSAVEHAAIAHDTDSAVTEFLDAADLLGRPACGSSGTRRKVDWNLGEVSRVRFACFT